MAGRNKFPNNSFFLSIYSVVNQTNSGSIGQLLKIIIFTLTININKRFYIINQMRCRWLNNKNGSLTHHLHVVKYKYLYIFFQS